MTVYVVYPVVVTVTEPIALVPETPVTGKLTAFTEAVPTPPVALTPVGVALAPAVVPIHL